MNEIVIVSAGLNLAYFLAAVFACWAVLRVLDALAGVKFKTAMERLHENPLALAIYLGLRFFGVVSLGAAFIR